jgi:NhaP-type Na+/H+ and K+/H+ antiporter
LIELNEVQKKSYIEWKVQKRANETIYQSDEVKIDGMRWKFIAEMESSEIFKVYVKQLSQG